MKEKNVINYNEMTPVELLRLYGSYGYTKYKMDKFEEYDFYAENKAFLVSGNIITFNDTNGVLKALKPDVTLSIIKNAKDTPLLVQRTCYDESVYRVSKGTGTFREIRQIGLECIGDIDQPVISEVLLLALKSLDEISGSFVLAVSNLDVMSAFLDKNGIAGENRSRILKCISEKNLHELTEICRSCSVKEEDIKSLTEILNSYGEAKKVIEKLRKSANTIIGKDELDFLEKAVDTADEKLNKKIVIDFSVVSDVKYYNGIVFNGFIENIPDKVLSGGQYDKLMLSAGKKSRAMGFAVYTDELERYNSKESAFDYDVFILYDNDESYGAVKELIKKYSKEKKRIVFQKVIPDGITYGKLIKIEGGKIIENDA